MKEKERENSNNHMNNLIITTTTFIIHYYYQKIPEKGIEKLRKLVFLPNHIQINKINIWDIFKRMKSNVMKMDFL